MTDAPVARPARSHVEVVDDGLAFCCPRCASDVTERFYGPCRPCRRELAAYLAGDPRPHEVPRFEPPMHVIPNAVATRD